MCRPSCCDKNGGQGAGVAAVAILIGAALVAAKIGPIVAGIVHTVLEVLRILALTTGLVLALAAVTWAAIWIARVRASKHRRVPLRLEAVHMGSVGPGKSPLLAKVVVQAQQAIGEGAAGYAIDPKAPPRSAGYRSVPRLGHPAKAGAGYDCACGACLAEIPADDQDAR
jgi:hypothetical protein